MRDSLNKCLGIIVLCIGMILAGSVFSASHAMYAPPYYDIMIGDQPFTEPMDYFWDPLTDVVHFYNPAPFFLAMQNNIQITVPENSFSFFLKWDPSLAYSLTLNNPSGEALTISTLSFAFMGEISPNFARNMVLATMDQYLPGATQISQLGYYDGSAWVWVNAGVDQPGGTSGFVSGPYGDWTRARIILNLDGVTLPAGDSTFSGRFNVNAVPVPAAIWLLGSGLLGMIGIRRRIR
jgi:hypothetical protein